MGVDRARYEDWSCPECDTSNFPSRRDCRQCGTAQPLLGGNGGSDGGGFGATGNGYAADGGGGGRDVQSMIDERAEARRNRDYGDRLVPCVHSAYFDCL